MSEHVEVGTRDGVCYIRLNRPEKKNALTLEMYAALADALGGAEADSAVRVVLLSGAGDAFTGGNDLEDFLRRPPVGRDTSIMHFLEALSGATKPLAAAVHGAAVGVGTTLLLHCDLVYAARSARFQLPFVGLGLVPEAGSTLLLPQRVGHARAAELMLLGEAFDAEEAERLGIVSAVFDEQELLPRVEERVRRLAAQPPAAVLATKALLREADRVAIRERMRREAESFLERLHSPEAREAIQAFLERRPPDFSRLQ